MSTDPDLRVETVYRKLRKDLIAHSGSEGEATAMARLIFRHLKGWDTTALVIHASDVLSDFFMQQKDRILERLENGEPIQYILGQARFHGMDLRVTPATLIPRPETEELVDLVEAHFRGRKDLRILDAGTGSGAIAVALSRMLPFSRVTAIDNSDKALQVARENAKNLHAGVTFLEADIFDYTPKACSFEIIVSNPPYVMESEKNGMDRRVLDHEPHTALFVCDSDPLAYYRKLLETGRTALVAGGYVYFEINPLQAHNLEEMCNGMGYTDVALHRDLSGKERFISACNGTKRERPRQ